jgi:hypothetical protein
VLAPPPKPVSAATVAMDGADEDHVPPEPVVVTVYVVARQMLGPTLDDIEPASGNGLTVMVLVAVSLPQVAVVTT